MTIAQSIQMLSPNLKQALVSAQLYAVTSIAANWCAEVLYTFSDGSKLSYEIHQGRVVAA